MPDVKIHNDPVVGKNRTSQEREFDVLAGGKHLHLEDQKRTKAAKPWRNTLLTPGFCLHS